MSLPFIPVSLERLQENSVRGLQEERESHKGGPWRQDPRADFIVGLGIRSAYGHLTNHAEILAMEYGELISRLAEVRKQLAELNADSTIPRAYDKRINVLFGHIYHEDITGPAQENAVGIMADRVSALKWALMTISQNPSVPVSLWRVCERFYAELPSASRTCLCSMWTISPSTARLFASP